MWVISFLWFKKKTSQWNIFFAIPVIYLLIPHWVSFFDTTCPSKTPPGSQGSRRLKKNLFLSQSEVGCDYYHGWESWSSVCATCTIFMKYMRTTYCSDTLFQCSDFLHSWQIYIILSQWCSKIWIDQAPMNNEPMQHWRCWFGNSCLRCCMFTLHSSSR